MAATMRIGFLEIVFVFLFIDLFDNIGTLVAVGKKANLFDKAHQIQRDNRIPLSDAATIAGLADGDLDRGELHRERGPSGGRRAHGRHGDRDRSAVRGGGLTAFTPLKMLRGKFREVSWFVYVLTAPFIARFVYLAK